jgi:hypothetical protein
MPTLIRLIIVLLFLAGLVYGGMVALVAFVEPTQKEVRVRIPTRDLLNEPTTNEPTGLPDLAPNVGEGANRP